MIRLLIAPIYGIILFSFFNKQLKKSIGIKYAMPIASLLTLISFAPFGVFLSFGGLFLAPKLIAKKISNTQSTFCAKCGTLSSNPNKCHSCNNSLS